MVEEILAQLLDASGWTAFGIGAALVIVAIIRGDLVSGREHSVVLELLKGVAEDLKLLTEQKVGATRSRQRGPD